MRYTKLRTWAILIIVALGVIIVLNYSGGGPGIYKSETPVSDSLITASYPDLYEAIFQRDTQLLKPFLSHENEEVRDQAWRAFANTPVDSMSLYIDLAMDQNSEAAWFGISQHPLNSDQLRALEQHWQNENQHRLGIARVLGQQGDKESLNFLLSNLDAEDVASEFQFGLAVGRLITRFDISGNQQIGVLQNAFDSANGETTRAYLYGWYRGDESRLTAVARDTLLSRWQIMGSGVSADIDQYVNKMLPAQTTSQLTIYYNGEQRLNSEVQLSVELARSVGEIELNDRNSLAAKILLTNTNPHVQVQTLQSLRGNLSRGGDLYNYISGTMLTDGGLSDKVWLQALETAIDVDSLLVEKYQDRLQKITEDNEYLLPQVLAIYLQTEDADRYIQRIRAMVDEGHALKTMYALEGLANFWENLPDNELTKDHREEVRNLVFRSLAMGDRGVAYMSESLLQKEQLFDSDDFDQINSVLSSFSLPEDIEVYQAFGSLYKNRFEEQAKPIIDSLAAVNVIPLNRSLADMGWDIDIPDTSRIAFRIPEWERLWELGRNPVWTLRTEKGDISIELSTLSAPATVAMVDSLSRSGVYDGVPFHRIVPNFVVQGGDIERSDGFGGPDFVIPTEASEDGFIRGAVGIASAGTDTEGSQYFIMHQWKPHLNGGYTRFGKVVDGLHVLDKIMIGDKVLSTSWY